MDDLDQLVGAVSALSRRLSAATSHGWTIHPSVRAEAGGIRNHYTRQVGCLVMLAANPLVDVRNARNHSGDGARPLVQNAASCRHWLKSPFQATNR